MNTRKIAIPILMMICLFAAVSNSQIISGKEGGESKRTMVFKKGTICLISELGTVVAIDDEGLFVHTAGPKENLPEKYRRTDLREGDRIMMLNGKSVNSVQEFEDGYKEIESGGVVEIGIKRDKIMKIVSFPRASADEFSNMKTMIVSPSEGKVHTAGIGEDSDGLIPVLDAGMIIIEDNNEVKVKMTLPNAQEITGRETFEIDDILISIQGRKFDSAAQFVDLLGEIPEGDEVEIEYLREGRKNIMSFKKKLISDKLNMEIR